MSKSITVRKISAKEFEEIETSNVADELDIRPLDLYRIWREDGMLKAEVYEPKPGEDFYGSDILRNL